MNTLHLYNENSEHALSPPNVWFLILSLLRLAVVLNLGVKQPFHIGKYIYNS